MFIYSIGVLAAFIAMLCYTAFWNKRLNKKRDWIDDLFDIVWSVSSWFTVGFVILILVAVKIQDRIHNKPKNTN